MRRKKGIKEDLMNKYPIFFKEKDLPMNETCMCWGLDIGDGWLSIVEDVAKKAEEWNNTHDDKIYASQVKEKFGGLRIYTKEESTEADDYIYEITNAAEDKSFETCETCGKPGKNITINGWVRTTCKDCIKT